MVTGVMFCQNNGFTLLVNVRMQHLMTEITGKTQRNGRHFFKLLSSGEVEPGCDATWFKEQNVIILPDESAWHFSMNELPVGRKKYIQLAATDISDQWKLTAELHAQNDLLLQRQGELNETIANLHILSREREMQKAKMRAHDVLGKHLTVLQGTIFGNQAPDYDLLRSLSQGLLDDLKKANDEPTPQDELGALTQLFGAIGVEVVASGSLPEDPEKGRLFVDIAREAINNAVRHGFATRVMIAMDESGNETSLEITDNGYPPLTIKEGGGISGMRKKVELFNGIMHVFLVPQFVISVCLPMRVASKR